MKRWLQAGRRANRRRARGRDASASSRAWRFEPLEPRLLLTAITGNILTDQTWTALGSPYEIQSNVQVAEGATLRIEPGAEVILNRGLSIGGTLLAEDVTFRFTSFYDLVVEGQQFGEPRGSLIATGCTFLGNPGQVNDELVFDANSNVLVEDSHFDAHIDVVSRSEQAVFNRNTFAGAQPITLQPSRVGDLYDNNFTAAFPVAVGIDGTTTQDVTWRPFSNVGRYTITGGGLSVAEDTTLSIRPGTEVVLDRTLAVGGTLLAEGAVFRFTSHHNLVVQGEDFRDPIGSLVATGSTFRGNPGQTNDQLVFEANSQVLVRHSEFDAAIFVTSRSATAVLDGNTFRGDSPLSVPPSRVEDLYDNHFTAPAGVTVYVSGWTTANTVWRPFSNVTRYELSGTGVTVAEGTTLRVQPGTEVVLGRALSVGGRLLADTATFRFTSHHKLIVEGEDYRDPIGTLVASGCVFLGNPNQTGDELLFEANSLVVLEDSFLDRHVFLTSRSETAVLDGNTFQAGSPVSVLPSRVEDLYDNDFAGAFPVTVQVAGTTTRDVAWRPFSNVSRYALAGSGVTVAEGTTLTVAAGSEVIVDRPLSIGGRLQADNVTFQFTSYRSLVVEGEDYRDPAGTLVATNCTFVGNPGQTGDALVLEANSTVTIRDSVFDEHIFLTSRSAGAVLDGNTFRAELPLSVLPSQAGELYDNQFTGPYPVTVNVAGTTTADVIWQPFSNVARYALLGSGVTVAAGTTLTVAPGTTVELDRPLSVGGTLRGDDAVFLFTSYRNLVVEGQDYLDPQGTLVATGCTFIGNPGQTGDMVRLEGGSTAVLTDNQFGIDIALAVSGAADVAIHGQNSISYLQMEGNFPAAELHAENVYWGTWDAATAEEQRSRIAERIFDHADNSSRATVRFEPWLAAPPGGYLTVTEIVPSQPVGGTIDHFDVRFNRAVLTRSFTVDDVAITSPAPGNPPVAVLKVEQRGPAEFRVFFDPQTGLPSAHGTYQIALGPHIQDIGGTPMDGDGDGQAGEASDAFRSSFRLEPAQLTVRDVAAAASPLVPGKPARVEWTVANAGAYEILGGWTDIIRLSADDRLGDSDPVIATIPRSGAIKAGQSHRFSEEVLVPGVLPGTGYRLFVESVLSRTAADHTGSDTASSGEVTVRVDQLAGTGQALGGRLSPDDLQDYFVLHLSPGQAAVLDVPDNGSTNVNVIAAKGRIPRQGSGAAGDYDYADTRTVRAARVEIPVVSEATEIYVQVYTPQVAAPADYSLSATTINVPPRVSGVSPQGLTVAPIEAIEVTFDRAMDPASFSLPGAVSLRGPAGELAVTRSWVAANRLRLAFAPQASVGQYTLTVGSQVADVNGWRLDGDGDGVGGEPQEDRFRTTLALAMHGEITDHRTIPANSVLTIDGDLRIADGASLTVGQGSVLKFTNGRGLQVAGDLVTLGTPERPVVFTSVADDRHGGDTNRDGGATLPTAGNWQGLTFFGTGVGRLTQTQIFYAGTAIDANREGANVRLSGGILAHGRYGIYTYSPYVEIEADNCLIYGFSVYGIHMRADSRGVFRHCTIVDNRDGIHLGGAAMTIQNSIVAFNQFRGLDHHGDPPQLDIRYSLFHNPTNIAWDDDPGLPDLTASGNLTLDPRFVDRENRDYRLADNSPAVDAAYGVQNLARDAAGNPRFDDRGVANSGAGWPTYADMGALERIQHSPSVNLAVKAIDVTAAASVRPNDPLQIEWQVSNTGSVPYPAGVVDAVYLSSDRNYDAGDLLLTEYTHRDALPPGAASRGLWSGQVPQAAAGPMFVLVVTNRQPQLQESQITDNLAIADKALAVDVPSLEVGRPQTGSLVRGQTRVFRFEASQGSSYRFTAESAGGGNLQLYVQRGVMPSAWDFAVADAAGRSTRREARLFDAEAGTYYVAVRADQAHPNLNFTLSAEQLSFGVRDVSPETMPLGAAATVRILGDAFSESVRVRLRDAAGGVWPAVVRREDAGTVFATFDLAEAAAAGAAALIVDNGDGQQVTLENAIHLGGEIASEFQTRLELPSLARPGRVVDLKIHYANTGNVDIAAPLLRLESADPQSQWQLPGSPHWISGTTAQLLALAAGGDATVLRPGEQTTATVRLRLPFEEGDLPVTLTYVTDSDQVIGWDALRGELFLQGLSDLDWSRIVSRVGTTWADYLGALRGEHQRLAELGWQTASVQDLFDEIADQALTLGDATVSGRLVESGSGQPIAEADLILFPQAGDGVARQARTNARGEFTFQAVTNDRFFVKVGGGYTTDDTPEVVVLADESVTGLEIVVRPQAAPPQTPEDEELLAGWLDTLTADGVTHLVFARGGQLYHAHSDGSGWSAATPVPGAVGEGQQLLYRPEMFGSGAAGLVLLWTQGEGNESIIRANFARRTPGGQWEWSAAGNFFAGTVGSLAPRLAVDRTGNLVATWLMSDRAADDDADIYYQITAPAAINPQWMAGAAAGEAVVGGFLTAADPAASGQDLVCAEGEAADECSGWSYAAEASATLFNAWTTVPGFVPLVGGSPLKAQAGTTSSISADINKAEAKGGISGSLNALDLVKGEMKGEAAEVYNLDRYTCTYVYAGGSGAIQGSVTGNVPLYWVDLPWNIGELQLGVRLNGSLGADYTPREGWKGKLEVGGGLYGTVSGAGDAFTVDASGMMFLPIDLQNGQFNFVTQEARVEWRVKVEIGWFSFEFGDKYPETAGAAVYDAGLGAANVFGLAPQSPLAPAGMSLPYTVSLTDYTGSTRVHGATPLLASVATDVVNETAPVLVTAADGDVYAFWTRDSEDRRQSLNNRILYARFDGASWSEPVELPGASGHARDLAAAVDSGGRILLTWSRADMTGRNISSNPEDVLAAYGDSDVYYAVMTAQGGWSAPAVLYDAADPSSQQTLAHDAAGDVWSAWWTGGGTPGGEGVLYAAKWDGGSWSSPQQVFAGQFRGVPRFAFPGDTPTLIWARDSGDGSVVARDGSLQFSEYAHGRWSYPRSLRVPVAAGALQSAAPAAAQAAALPPMARAIIPSDYYQSPFGLFATLVGSIAVPACACEAGEDLPPPEAPQPPAPDPTPGGGQPGGQGKIPIYTSHTPEDKYGPAGYDPPGTSEDQLQRYVALGEALEYRVEFWNEVDAVVPTQDALIVDTLDPAVFDLSTLEFTRVGFLSWDQPLPGGQSIDVRLDPRPELGCVVDVTNSFDPLTGRIEWYFKCVDPLTGDYPADPKAGFLPAFNPDTRYELGWVEFRVHPRGNLPSGTIVSNQAFVAFDDLWKPDPYEDLPNHPAPKLGPWINTIDAGAPVSRVRQLPPESPPWLRVEWSGEDDAGGSGVAHYDIYVSENGAPFRLWLDDTPQTSAAFRGQAGSTYAFYSIATDHVGQQESGPPAGGLDTQTLVTVSRWQNPVDPLDVDGGNGPTPQDVLILINRINEDPDNLLLPSAPDSPPPYYDVNGDGYCSAMDVLAVITYLNAQAAAEGQPPGGESEPEERAVSGTPAAPPPLAGIAIAEIRRSVSLAAPAIPAPASPDVATPRATESPIRGARSMEWLERIDSQMAQLARAEPWTEFLSAELGGLLDDLAADMALLP